MTKFSKNYLLLAFMLLISVAAFAQPDNATNREAGKCYAKCVVPNQYDSVTEQVQVKAGYSRLEVVEPQYETVSEQVMVKAASYRIVPVPAVYETVTEQVMVKAESKRYVAVEGSYQTVTNDFVYLGDGQGISTEKGSILDPNNPNGLNGTLNPSNATSPYNPNNPYNIFNLGTFNPNDPSSPLNPSNPNSPFNPKNIKGATGPNAAAAAGGSGRNLLGIGTVDAGAIQTANIGGIYPYLIKEASVKVERVPAQYETQTETVEVSSPSTKWVKKAGDRNCLSEDPNDCLVWCLVETPAQYNTVTKTLYKGCPAGYLQSGSDRGSKDECVRITHQPAVYGARSIVSQAPSYREEIIPAEYSTITKQVLRTPATFRTEYVPGEYKTVTRTIRKGLKSMNYVDPTGLVITLPAGRISSAGADTAGSTGYPGVINPGTGYPTSGVSGNGFPTNNPFDNLGVPGDASSGVNGASGNGSGTGTSANGAGGKITEPNLNGLDNFYTAGCPSGYTFDPVDGTCKKLVNIPAEYSTVSKRVLTKQGGLTEWKEVLCGNKVTSSKISQIQEALRSRGYNPGPSDNVMGAATKAALTKFQKDNSLPIGQLDMETLKALGIKY